MINIDLLSPYARIKQALTLFLGTTEGDIYNQAIKDLQSIKKTFLPAIKKTTDCDLIDQEFYYIRLRGTWCEAMYSGNEGLFVTGDHEHYMTEFPAHEAEYVISISDLDKLLDRS